MFARMLGFLRRLLVKTPVIVVLALAAAYFLFAWFGFEPLVKWAAPKYIADKSGHHLSIAGARFDPLRLSIAVDGLKLVEPDGKPLLAFRELFVDFDASSLFRWAYTFDAIRLTGPDARLELRPDGRLNWSALIDALKSKDEEPDKPLPRLLIRSMTLEQGQMRLADRTVDFETAFNPLDFTLTDFSTLPDDKGANILAATTQLGARVRRKGEVGLAPVLATGELAIDRLALDKFWPYLQTRLNMAPPTGDAALSLVYRAGYADKKFSLLVDRLAMAVEGLALKGRTAIEPPVSLKRGGLAGGRFDLDERQLDLGEIAIRGGKVALNRDRAGKLDVTDWFASGDRAPTAAAKTPVTEAQSPSKNTGPVRPWRINLQRFALNGLELRFTDAGFSAPLTAEVGNIQAGFSARAEAGATVQALLESLAVEVSGIRLLSTGQKDPLFVLGGASLQDGRIDLAARQAAAGRVSLVNGRAAVVRDGRGRIALAEAFRPVSGKPAAVTAARSPKGMQDAGWKWKIGHTDLSGFQVVAREETVQPAGGLTLDRINATVSGASDNLKAPLPVKLSFQVKEGGSFQADGKVVPAVPSADLRVKLSGLALAPVQPWLSQAANLTLASGQASLQGRVKYAGQADFRGGFTLDDLRLNETAGGERFLAWKRMSSDSVHAGHDGLNVEEIRLDGLGAKLVIYRDKTVNLKKILKSAPPEGAKTPAAPPPPEPGPAAVSAPAYPVAIERVRIDNGELDFAELSLALPFGTRVHHFKGAVNGISTRSGSPAELELDGQVDEFGLARAAGQIDLGNPTGFMDVKAVFRNVEMTSLTPYTATFVGRKIQSGKLSLDLEYKLKDRQLLGENQIIMDRLTLGERVESPTAKDLPLDLAIAILQDSDGRIDLGLPVSGSLDDPQFSYGRIIWKAIGNLLTKIVTAPFRALGALFGGDGEKLEKIAFEAGESQLTPPEREKFKQISQILGKRPGLALTVQGAWSAEIDRPTLKEIQLRRAVADRMGVKLAAGEDAGPISTRNSKVQSALEALYVTRFGEADWKSLQAKWQQANPEQKRGSATGRMVSRIKTLFKPEQPLSAEELGQLKDADLHGLLYQRLLEQEAVSDEALAQLARRRGQAVLDGLVAAGAPADRIRAGEISKYEGEGREVPAKLELGVAKR